MGNFDVFVTEPIPEIDFGLRILEDARVRIKDKFVERVSSEDLWNVDAIIAGDSKITRESLERANRLRVIGRFGAGIDSVDIQACTEKGILLFNAPGLNAQSVAEHTIGLMVAISKRFKALDALVRSGRWAEKSNYMGNELYEKTLGIIGLGSIGSKLARMAQAFDVKVVAYDPYVTQDKATKLGVEMVDLEPLLRNSDYVSVNAPLTGETRGLIGEKQLRMMKKDAILINTARGGLVDEKALFKALDGQWIAGAGVDVLENEPVTSHPLFGLDNVVFTPHAASWTVEAFRRIAIVVCENILKTMRGGVPDNLVNPQALKKSGR